MNPVSLVHILVLPQKHATIPTFISEPSVTLQSGIGISEQRLFFAWQYIPANELQATELTLLPQAQSTLFIKSPLVFVHNSPLLQVLVLLAQ